MNEPLRKASMLIVDDAIEDLGMLAGMLAEQGYDVRPFTSGQLALRAASEDPPSLILLDITMPGMDGYQVCERLKKMDGVRDVPVIFLMALDDMTDKVKTFDVGGVDYITKPFQLDEVLARVRTHLALQRARFELRENYERLQVVERVRHDLVRMVVHDMRSPLMALLAQLDMARLEAAGALRGQIAEYLDDAIHAAETLMRMANDLLDVSRLEEGKMPIVRSACDLAQLASHVRATMAHRDRTRVIELNANGPIYVAGDERIVYRVMENLVDNAIKHTPAGGRIRISVGTSSGRVRVAIADEGPGVPREARQEIFEKFATVSTRHNDTCHSSGLGLAFCKLAVEAHDGVIGLNDGESGGSVFWFELPNLL
jgi:two-component system, sensor histidine kinase and response regulator